MKSYLYSPEADRWREVANPQSGERPGYYGGVRLDDGRIVVNAYDPSGPLRVLDLEAGTWTRSGSAPGLLPVDPLVSTGSSVFLWGIGAVDHTVRPRSPNAAWLWWP